MYEVIKVANGWMVRPTYNKNPGVIPQYTDVYVFTDWSELSEWLDRIMN